MRDSLRSGGLQYNKPQSGFNPMEGLANLADCMLVLACGLMLSLIVSWNLDIEADQTTAVPEQSSVTAVDGMEDSDLNDIDENSGYEEMGKVYKDPETGQLYMVTNK